MLFFVFLLSGAEEGEYSAPHPDCVFFGPKHDKYAAAGRRARGIAIAPEHQYALSMLTDQVAGQLGFVPGGSRTSEFQKFGRMGIIDRYVFQAIANAGVTPADPTTDFEFIRRATLDLTGRIPTSDRVLSFAADPSPDKRTRLVDELLAKPEWIDKWTMYFGDLFKNNSANSQIRRYDQGVVAFNNWIRASLTTNKSYDQMARELIMAQGTNSYQQGEINFLVGGYVTGGPIQDIFDQQTANAADTFLGIAHVNCLLCHNGAGHLDALSLWGKSTSRYQAWQLSSFLSHTEASRTPVDPAVPNPYYWSLADNTPRARVDYPLNTTSGNRPPRQPIGNVRNIAPVYLFSGRGPNAGEDNRAALAREITSDFQFSRAAVNYIWKEFFGVGIVDPPDQFDPARIDPSNPPAAPWVLQPSNPYLLNVLAQSFIDNNYDLKWLMRQIVNSRAYQLSSRYNGAWNPAWQQLFARKMVRRLWSEELHDAVTQSSNIIPAYSVANSGTLNWAMQFPEPLNTPSAGNPITVFLDAFLRGNRDDEQRSDDGSISQALGLMNDTFIMSRVKSTGAPASSLLIRNLTLPDDQLVNTLFLNVLSRYPTDAERAAALNNLRSGNRNQEAENLLWSLYNKVDFIFNY